MQVASDLHLEFRDGRLPKDALVPQAPYLALAGDVGSLTGDIRNVWYERFLRDCASKWSAVYLVAGNHEYYNCNMRVAQEKFLELGKKIPGVVPMEKTAVQLGPEMGNVMLLGTTLWSYVPPECAFEVAETLSDYRVIRNGYPGGRTHKLTVKGTNSMHAESVEWLETELQACKEQHKRAIVLTHHSPLPPSPSDFTGCGWSTDLTYMMDSEVIAAWIHGHTHTSANQLINGVPVISNQMGYEEPSKCGYQKGLILPESIFAVAT